MNINETRQAHRYTCWHRMARLNRMLNAQTSKTHSRGQLWTNCEHHLCDQRTPTHINDQQTTANNEPPSSRTMQADQSNHSNQNQPTQQNHTTQTKSVKPSTPTTPYHLNTAKSIKPMSQLISLKTSHADHNSSSVANR